MQVKLSLLILFTHGITSVFALSSNNEKIENFIEAKKHLPSIHESNPTTIYCGCKYTGKVIDLKSCGYKVHRDAKRAARLEWEHVVPAHAFGQSFPEWRSGDPKCISKNKKKFKGRKCARTNQAFARMEADMYNLQPEIGELNGLRSNFSMTSIGANNITKTGITFGECKSIIQDRKFEPMDMAKGVVARTYMYMDQAYPGKGIISDKNQKLFEAWDKMYPVKPWECERAAKIGSVQGNINPILTKSCK
jgi:deoxyribonuclease-1